MPTDLKHVNNVDYLECSRVVFRETVTVAGCSMRECNAGAGFTIRAHTNNTIEIIKDGFVTYLSPHHWVLLEPQQSLGQPSFDTSGAASHAEVAAPMHYDNNREQVQSVSVSPNALRRGPGRPRKNPL